MRLMKLYVDKKYRNREVEYTAGKTIEVPEDEAEFLLKDAPGCFEVVEEKAEKAVKAPEVNKMIDESIEDKGSQGARGK